MWRACVFTGRYRMDRTFEMNQSWPCCVLWIANVMCVFVHVVQVPAKAGRGGQRERRRCSHIHHATWPVRRRLRITPTVSRFALSAVCVIARSARSVTPHTYAYCVSVLLDTSLYTASFSTLSFCLSVRICPLVCCTYGSADCCQYCSRNVISRM